MKNKADEKGIAGLSITVKDKRAGILLNYALTDDKGGYHINLSSTLDSLLITVSGLNIEKQEKIFKNINQDLDFNVNVQAIKLKEIKVNPPRIRMLSDTINYTVDGFIDQNDRTIGDVLKKLPGIEVKDDGSILYNNKPINKFYIEEKDLLQGRYGIATNNIQAKDVEAVQVLENHQPIKALKNKEFTTDAGLNIKLKESAKGILSMTAKVGAGLSPALWDNELFSMYFNKNKQNITTYKGNNTGSDPGTDFTSHYAAPNRTDNETSLSVQSPAIPSINQKRYLFNHANAFSINNLWAYGKETQVSFNISYLNDHQDRSSFSRSVYYLPNDSTLDIDEKLTSNAKINQFNGALKINTNKENYYLDNLFSFSGQRNQTEGSVIHQDTVFQQLKDPLYQFDNTFSLIRNYKKISFKFFSYTSYTSTPELLNIQPVLYNDIFTGIEDPLTMRQNLIQKKFIFKNKVSFGLNSRHFKQNYSIGINTNLQDFRSKLGEQSSSGRLSATQDSLSNHLRWNKIEMYFNPDYTYVSNKFRLEAILLLNYTHLYTDDLITEQDKVISRLFFNPAVILNYDLNPLLSLSADARYNNRVGELNDVFTGYIMESYRNLVKNDGKLPENQNQTYNLTLNYRHPIHELFINLGSSYSRDHFNLLYSYDYQGVLSIKNTNIIPNIKSMSTVFGRVSKGIDAIGGTITVYTNYSHSLGKQISQDKILNYKNQVLIIRPIIDMRIKSWTSLTYTFQYTQSKNAILNDISTFPAIYGNTQIAQLNFFPSKGLTINLAHEYYYSSATSTGNKAMNFTDAGIKYLYKNLEFNAEYNNIFNSKQFISASYIDTSMYYYAYNLRPAQVLLKARFKIK
ncbi:hypothetical protein [Pedobacter sp. L105]|uniref:hypothetical protein n=1 Tax=Pedobacter sp. L105 TaxID=1641871 RepID=UPI00131DBF84|nr:hypothetical protein [Pedobacter sp. L105]